MKALFCFVLGAIVGAYCLRLYEHRSAVPPNGENPALGDTTREAASGMKEAFSEKLVEWHLTAPEIRDDLARTGQVVREKAQVAGAQIADARIVTVIKAKYVLDKNLSACDLHVECREGIVTLSGAVVSTDLIAHAVSLALDTGGVRRVIAQIALKG